MDDAERETDRMSREAVLLTVAPSLLIDAARDARPCCTLLSPRRETGESRTPDILGRSRPLTR